jgi:serine/threonine-protein kinase
MDVLEGTVINGKFRVTSLLATGGMGRIYLAEQAPLGRLVVVKVLRTPAIASDTVGTEFRKRFLREASILAKLQHPNVVTLFDYGRIEGLKEEHYFMAMEYLQGDTLSVRLRRARSLAVQDSLRILRQIARGLREAHRLGVVHRDLKPSNIMLVPEDDGVEMVKILDFGIGKVLGDEEDQEITQEGAFLGSPKYIAPEQVNERHVDGRTDVYALGVIAYECLCGQVPFEGQTNLETILAHTNKPVPLMSDRVPGTQVPELVERFVRRCLEKEPSERPQSMEEVLRLITECEQRMFGATSLGAMQTEPSPSQRTPVMRRAGDSGTVRLGPNQSGGTASPLTRSERAPAPPPSRVPVVAAAALLVVAAGVFAAARVRTGTPDGRATAAPAGSPPPVLAPASTIAASAAPAEPSATASEATAAAATASVPPPTASASAFAAPPQRLPPRWFPPRSTVATPEPKPPQETDIKLQR